MRNLRRVVLVGLALAGLVAHPLAVSQVRGFRPGGPVQGCVGEWKTSWLGGRYLACTNPPTSTCNVNLGCSKGTYQEIEQCLCQGDIAPPPKPAN